MRLRIVDPCPVDFNAMREDGGGRFCERCDKHVYDLTCASGEEVRAFVARHGRVCARIAAAAIALAGCSAADQTAPPTVQIGPLPPAPVTQAPKPDAGTVKDDVDDVGEYLLGEIGIDDTD